ncbi:hypothetical protein ACVWW6_004512 [Bradyrhizobium sp. USDA 3311]
MIDASTFLRRALLADVIFSGAAALGFTFGAGAFATLFNLPEALLRETGLFLIAYTALVGWLAVPRRSPPVCSPSCNMWDCGRAGASWRREAASAAVVARFSRATQYSRDA